MDPLFSVILPTYDRPIFLAEAIDSVLRQTMKDFELIVVDDASPTPVVVPSDPRIRVTRRVRSGGPAAARNTGLGLACGRFVAFLDDDNRYLPDRLELAVQGLERAPISVCWNQRQGRQAWTRVLDGSVGDSILSGPIACVGVTAMERRLVPAFDERFLATEDAEWWLRVAALGAVSTVSRIGHFTRTHDAPRHICDARAHRNGSLLLLKLHADYFGSHPQSYAYRQLLLWQNAQKLGEYKVARRAAVQALRYRPDLRAVWRLARSIGRRSPRGDEAAAAAS
jgi:glycosyltransferase involved in cell wall biosynthesis